MLIRRHISPVGFVSSTSLWTDGQRYLALCFQVMTQMGLWDLRASHSKHINVVCGLNVKGLKLKNSSQPSSNVKETAQPFLDSDEETRLLPEEEEECVISLSSKSNHIPSVLVVVMSPLSFNATELWSQSISYQTSKLPVDGQKFSVFYTRYTISVI